MPDASTLLTAAAGLAGMLLTYWLGTANTAAKDRRDLSDKLRATLRTRVNFQVPIGRPSEDEFHRILTLTPILRRRQLAGAIREYQRAESAWRQDSVGQAVLLDPKAAQAARDRLIELLP